MRPTLLKFVPDFTTRPLLMNYYMTTWSWPPRTRSTPFTLLGNCLSAALRMWVRAITRSHFSDYLR